MTASVSNQIPSPETFAVVLKAAVLRLRPEGALAWPQWVARLRAPEPARALTRWLRSTHDVQLIDAGRSLEAALGSAAEMLLLEVAHGWYGVDCRGGVATLWTVHGAQTVPLSALDSQAVQRIVSLRPAQDVAPRAATSAAHQPLFMPFLRENRGRLVELAIAGVVINLVGLLPSLFSMLLYDRVIGNAIVETLWALVLGLSIFVMLELVLRVSRSYTIETVAARMDARTDRKLFERLMGQRGPMPPVGIMLARYRDLIGAREILSSSWLMALVDLPFVVVYLVLAWIVGGVLAVVPVVMGLLMVGVQMVLHHPASSYNVLASKAQTGKINTLAETLAVGEAVRVTPMRFLLSRRFGQLAERAAMAHARGRYWHQLTYHVSNTMGTLCWLAVLVVGAYEVGAGLLSVGGLIATSMLSSRAMGMLSSVGMMGARWSELKRAIQSMDELVVDSAPARTIATGSALWVARSHSLRLRDLSFDHGPGQPLFEKLNLDIAPGELVVLLGRPGAGKSTLLKLMGGLLAPTRGDAMLDGHSVLDWPPEVRARRIGIKPQEAVLFEGTLAENIVGGAEAYVDSQGFAEALGVSGIDQWIAKGQLSLSQAILPGGVNLSGGQRQVVALARALAAGCPVLLLDEPTVGLDHETEAGIVARLRAWGSGRTLVVATHSMALVNVADRIVMIEGGRIVANGPRNEMMAGAPPSAAPRPVRAASPA